ncbi:MAG: RNA polymerase sigma factor [Muribaculaceae bacterium]|nr:RNA polymerase sigma factor [Muribaculaceae bacterium]
MTREQFIKHAEGCQKALRRYLTALCCGDSQLADDIAQETLVKAYVGCDGFRDAAKFDAWIHRIAYNTFISSRRAARHDASVEEARHVVADGAGADRTFDYEALYFALGQLPGHERSAILLYYMEGYSVKEIAEITDSRQETVRQHLSRGRVHLRGMLQKDTI